MLKIDEIKTLKPMAGIPYFLIIMTVRGSHVVIFLLTGDFRKKIFCQVLVCELSSNDVGKKEQVNPVTAMLYRKRSLGEKSFAPCRR